MRNRSIKCSRDRKIYLAKFDVAKGEEEKKIILPSPSSQDHTRINTNNSGGILVFMIMWNSFFFFLNYFCHTRRMKKSPGQGLKPSDRTDNTRSLAIRPPGNSLCTSYKTQPLFSAFLNEKKYSNYQPVEHTEIISWEFMKTWYVSLSFMVIPQLLKIN